MHLLLVRWHARLRDQEADRLRVVSARCAAARASWRARVTPFHRGQYPTTRSHFDCAAVTCKRQYQVVVGSPGMFQVLSGVRKIGRAIL